MAVQVKDRQQKQVALAPFAVEADHPRNCDLLLQAVPGLRLRSRITHARQVWDRKTGRFVVPPDQTRHLGLLPEIPGMRLYVDPKSRKYKVTDPLYRNQELCEQIYNALKADGRPVPFSSVRGVPPQEGELDEHRMKTLCRELVRLLDLGHVRVVSGPQPTIEDVDRLPGKYLLNPGARVPNTQPMFEEDWDQWLETLKRAGG